MQGRAELTATVRVVVADDDEDMRVLMRSMLGLDPRIHIVGEASDGDEALARFDELRPDVLVLDERMPGLRGLEVAERVLAAHPEQVIILCTAFVDRTMQATAGELGVRRVLGKSDVDQLGAEILRLAVPSPEDGTP